MSFTLKSHLNQEELDNIFKNQKFHTIKQSKFLKIKKISKYIKSYNLELQGSGLKKVPKGIKVSNRLDLSDSFNLQSLPENLSCNQLILRNCVNLRVLPRGLHIKALDISGCSQIESLPTDIIIEDMELIAQGCRNLSKLGGTLRNLTRMDIRGCQLISDIPNGTTVSRWIDIGGTNIKALPESLVGVGLKWNGVDIDYQTAFNPESITVDDIFNEKNAEVRRVKISRLGYERFFEKAEPDVLDEDMDAGGRRKLLKIDLERQSYGIRDEPVVCLSMHCPSTGRKYFIRVPPRMETCRAAAAWIAGFENPEDYNPIYET